MLDAATHSFLSQIPLTISPFLNIPQPVTLPSSYIPLPRTLPPSSSGLFSDVERIARSVKEQERVALERHKVAQEQFAQWERNMSYQDTMQKRHTAPGYLDTDVHLLKPTYMDGRMHEHGSSSALDMAAISSLASSMATVPVAAPLIASPSRMPEPSVSSPEASISQPSSSIDGSFIRPASSLNRQNSSTTNIDKYNTQYDFPQGYSSYETKSGNTSMSDQNAIQAQQPAIAARSSSPSPPGPPLPPKPPLELRNRPLRLDSLRKPTLSTFHIALSSSGYSRGFKDPAVPSYIYKDIDTRYGKGLSSTSSVSSGLYEGASFGRSLTRHDSLLTTSKDNKSYGSLDAKLSEYLGSGNSRSNTPRGTNLLPYISDLDSRKSSYEDLLGGYRQKPSVSEEKGLIDLDYEDDKLPDSTSPTLPAGPSLALPITNSFTVPGTISGSKSVLPDYLDDGIGSAVSATTSSNDSARFRFSANYLDEPSTEANSVSSENVGIPMTDSKSQKVEQTSSEIDEDDDFSILTQKQTSSMLLAKSTEIETPVDENEIDFSSEASKNIIDGGFGQAKISNEFEGESTEEIVEDPEEHTEDDIEAMLRKLQEEIEEEDRAALRAKREARRKALAEAEAAAAAEAAEKERNDVADESLKGEADSDGVIDKRDVNMLPVSENSEPVEILDESLVPPAAGTVNESQYDKSPAEEPRLSDESNITLSPKESLGDIVRDVSESVERVVPDDNVEVASPVLTDSDFSTNDTTKRDVDAAFFDKSKSENFEDIHMQVKPEKVYSNDDATYNDAATDELAVNNQHVDAENIFDNVVDEHSSVIQMDDTEISESDKPVCDETESENSDKSISDQTEPDTNLNEAFTADNTEDHSFSTPKKVIEQVSDGTYDYSSESFTHEIPAISNLKGSDALTVIESSDKSITCSQSDSMEEHMEHHFDDGVHDEIVEGVPDKGSSVADAKVKSDVKSCKISGLEETIIGSEGDFSRKSLDVVDKPDKSIRTELDEAVTHLTVEPHRQSAIEGTESTDISNDYVEISEKDMEMGEKDKEKEEYSKVHDDREEAEGEGEGEYHGERELEEEEPNEQVEEKEECPEHQVEEGLNEHVDEEEECPEHQVEEGLNEHVDEEEERPEHQVEEGEPNEQAYEQGEHIGHEEEENEPNERVEEEEEHEEHEEEENEPNERVEEEEEHKDHEEEENEPNERVEEEEEHKDHEEEENEPNEQGNVEEEGGKEVEVEEKSGVQNELVDATVEVEPTKESDNPEQNDLRECILKSSSDDVHSDVVNEVTDNIEVMDIDDETKIVSGITEEGSSERGVNNEVPTSTEQ
ncbi:hypothetical protein V1511DRAFT_534172 [Dipodascopsis uninucleata]